MHRHIAWHTVEGLAVQVLEQPDEIPALIDTDELDSNCSSGTHMRKRLSQGLDDGV
jgi:hypothetical protein